MERSFRSSSAALGLALALAVGGAAAAQDMSRVDAHTGAAGELNATVLAEQILARWEPVAEAAGAYDPAWKEVFGAQLTMLNARALARLDALAADPANAEADYKRFTKAFIDAQATAIVRLQSAKGLAKLGSATTDQVFIPVVPCRLVDTRIVGGPIAAGAPRSYWFYDAGSVAFNWNEFQGGATSCPGTRFTGSIPPTAALLTIGVVGPSAAGNWIVWGGTNPIPNASALNWSGAGQVLVNTTVVPAGGRSGSGASGIVVRDFAVAYNGPSGSAHFTADIVGYFVENFATALQCVEVDQSGEGSFPNNSNLRIGLPVCPIGYTATGSSCSYFGTLAISVFLQESSRENGGCVWRNASGGSTGASGFSAHTQCCRIPGR